MKRNSGFTLIELLLVIALVSISVGVTGDILVSLVRSFNKSTLINELEQQANFLGLKLEKELRNASNVVVTNGGTRISFEDPSTNITICYNVANNNIYRTTTTGACVWSTSNANALVATPLVGQTVGGVHMACNPTCFIVTTGTPQVVDIALVFRQAQATPSPTFEGEVQIINTIVIRNSY
ncbi:type II secretion system protein [candidate division WWE3 bacterium]|jgi:prepilin-type N-terminal cleavage/methylation domain-containing protein|uniref:Type II secretion system protein n=1 Tax=candidate division WWE3 bacterium TaxID=2053526 RepID=A0A3A4ZLJ5_UNCKA|nr:MAG: type II secretion system protein [candidate division WWE3 bacterium]